MNTPNESRAQPVAAHTQTQLRFIYRDGRRTVYVVAHTENAALKALPFTVQHAYPKEAADYWQAFTYSGNEIVYWTRGDASMLDDAGRRFGCYLSLCMDTDCEVFASTHEDAEAAADQLCARLNAGIDAQFALARACNSHAALVAALEQLVYAVTVDAPTPLPDDSPALIWSRAALVQAKE